MGLRLIRTGLASFLLLLPHLQAGAWGSEGHRIIADIAWDHLDDTARQKLRQYLGDNDLASISTWADDIRSGHPQTGPWHYVDIPSDASGYEPRDCPDDNCVWGRSTGLPIS